MFPDSSTKMSVNCLRLKSNLQVLNITNEKQKLFTYLIGFPKLTRRPLSIINKVILFMNVLKVKENNQGHPFSTHNLMLINVMIHHDFNQKNF